MESIYHESAKLHATGEAIYVNDISVSQDLLLGYIFGSPFASAKILSFDLTEAKKVNGVHSILSHFDILGAKKIGAVIHDEEVLAIEKVNYIGQPIFLIAAETLEAANEAKRHIKIEFEILDSILTIEQAIEKNNLLQAPRKIECGNISQAFSVSPHILSGEFRSGGQEHWYLETQVALCIPSENNEVKVFSSTQNPTETQCLVAEVLGYSFNSVEVETRRLGGAFGGKESQASNFAVYAALLSQKTKKPVKIHLSREEDQKITGKRHEFLTRYRVAFNDDGEILALDLELNANAGSSTDLSMAILERAMLHSDNAYFIPNFRIIGKCWKTNLPSNTAFRGFGGPQGMVVTENIIHRIARFLEKNPLEVQKQNFYKIIEKNVTPYGQIITQNHIPVILENLLKTSNFQERSLEIEKFNKENEFLKRGIAISPVKFGISFTTSFLNQAGALVNIYTDGTVLVNHGGTEMGQGLYTKMQQIAAFELGIDVENVKVCATNTAKVPNTSPTAASSGTDLNGMAVKNAISQIKTRLSEYLLKEWNKNSQNENFSKIENIRFENNFIFDSENPERKIDFKTAVKNARIQQISLSSTGFYKTPDIFFDRNEGKGKPFHYFAYGMSVTEVLVDTLTGKVSILRSDILNDTGNSINENIDIGQVEGAYIQGVGWITTEECKYDSKGNLLNASPDTYKIPTICDIPQDFRVSLLRDFPNHNTILKSKAVGEPPFMLAISCFLAIKNAVAAVRNNEFEPELKIPATNEEILRSIEKLKKL